jgi:hypothetical protein
VRPKLSVLEPAGPAPSRHIASEAPTGKHSLADPDEPTMRNVRSRPSDVAEPVHAEQSDQSPPSPASWSTVEVDRPVAVALLPSGQLCVASSDCILGFDAELRPQFSVSDTVCGLAAYPAPDGGSEVLVVSELGEGMATLKVSLLRALCSAVSPLLQVDKSGASEDPPAPRAISAGAVSPSDAARTDGRLSDQEPERDIGARGRERCPGVSAGPARGCRRSS